MQLTTVVAFKNSLLAGNGHVLVELSSLYFHATIFVGVRDDFEKTLGKMDLLKKEANLREVRCLNKFGLSYGDESMKTFTSLILSSPIHSHPSPGHLIVREEFSSL